MCGKQYKKADYAFGSNPPYELPRANRASEMNCALHYDLFARDDYNVWLVIVSFSLFLVGIALHLAGGRFSRNGFLVSRILRRIFRGGGIGFALAWAVMAVYVINARNADYDRLLALHSSGKESVVTGIVTNFSPFGPRPHGRPKETFEVEGVPFAYPPDNSTTMLGFSKLSGRGGPLRDNLSVRVSYIEDRIVRLEICNP